MTDTVLTIDERCEFLTQHYDYDRAQALLDSLGGPNKEFENVRGPVMVLDLGFDAVVVPMDNVETENMERIPDIWKQAIDDALKNAKLLRSEAIRKMTQLDREIAELEATARDPAVKKKAKNKANKAAQEKRKERRTLAKRLFGKNSWGRAIACGFSDLVLKAAKGIVPTTEFLEAKVKSWCGAGDTRESGAENG